MTDTQALFLVLIAAPAAIVLTVGLLRGYSVWISIHKPHERDEEDT